MVKKNKKKNYGGLKKMELVCVQCRRLFRKCECGASLEDTAYILVTKKELQHYYDTGLVPNHKAELLYFESGPKPEPIPLIHPPVYGFKTD